MTNRQPSRAYDTAETGKQDEETRDTAPRSRRGFASMDPETVRQIARKGGHAAHAKGTAHEWTSEEARAAGRIGGQHSHSGGRPASTTR